MVTGRALVTGATGGLGRVLVDALLSLDREVVALGRVPEAGRALTKAGCRFASVDLRTGIDARHLEGVSTVFHLAALSSPWGRREDFVSVNVDATRMLLDAARATGCGRFVHVSTPSIYARAADQIGIREDTPLPPRFATSYAETKLEAERMVLAADDPDMRTVAVRPRAIVCPGDRVLLPRLRRASAKGVMPMPGGGRALLELTDARDVADALLAAERRIADAHGRAFNVSGGDPRPFAEILRIVFAELGADVRLVSVPAAAAVAAARFMEAVARLLPGCPEPPLTVHAVTAVGYAQTFDLTLAERVLDWRPTRRLEDSVRWALGRSSADRLHGPGSSGADL